ncbi:MAG: META domain-containing protein [Anaerolineales bacterium]|nr:META domain-containing protein [Anaerolineales bacterium]
MKYVLLLAFLLGLGITAGCSANGASAVSLEQTTWQLEMLGTQPALTARPVTLIFQADNHVGGEAGCNSYGGTYSLNGDQLTFSYLTSTLMACAEPEFMEQEQKYLTSLAQTAGYKLEGNRLTILDAKGVSLLSFVGQ